MISDRASGINSDFTTSILNFFQSDSTVNQIAAGTALFFVKYPVEVMGTAVFNKMKLTTMPPLITLKTWKHWIFNRRPREYIRLSFGANVFAPIVEEVFMRGIIQSAIKNAALMTMDSFEASVLSIALTSVPFVMAHHLSPNGAYTRSQSNFVTINQFVNSVFFGLAKEMSGGLVAPISLHFFHNLINAELVDRRTNQEVLIGS